MNPGGIVEETGATARSFFNAMNSVPLALALVVVVLAQLGYIYYQGIITNNARRANIQTVIEWQKEVQRLLAQCIVPPRSDIDPLQDPPKPHHGEMESPQSPTHDPT